ncbi:MAG: hypothetical protein SGJ20_11095, partial [Planctomycetota bacterium]|nr:hypothetical protein [Planctomycetota bacterium]
TPVKLNRQQSAMLPIVNEKVEGEKLSIYNQRVHAKHPLNGLKLKNATKLHLMQGPITVFDGNVYAGDARIEDLPPGSERLVSYAMDLDTEVAPETKQHPEQLVSVKLIKGVLHTSRKYTREQNYTIKNSGDREKKVLIEYPLESQWKLITPQEPAEKTRDLYRFAVQAKPGKAETLAVKEELMMDQQIAVSNINDQMILTYINSKVISDETKKALQEVIARKQEIQQLAQQQGNKQQQIQAIDQEQNRIRQNMNQLDRNSELYNRYVKKLGEQETKVDTLREEFKKFQSKQQSEQKSLDDFLINFAEEK